jgi:hypothetical protein
MQVLHEVFAAGFEIREDGDLVADGLEVVLCQGDAYAAGHGDEVEYGVGAAAEDHDDGDGVVESLAGHDVAGLDIFFQQQADGGAGCETFLFFSSLRAGFDEE